jgi:protein-arginine kinase
MGDWKQVATLADFKKDDRLFVEAQPGHVQHAVQHDLEAGERDGMRATRLRAEFARFPAPATPPPSGAKSD